MITDLTKGSPSKVLWKFSIPMLLSVVFQQMYNIADSVVAGNFVGKNALAAVGASYPVTMIFMAVATGANIGCSVVISQLFGARKLEKMKTAVFTSLFSVVGISVLLSGLGFLFSSALMTLLQTPDVIFGDAQLYLNIYIGGLVFLFLYNICTGIFTALGDSRTPLFFLIASSVSNIFMDILFVTAFQMGVGGVAWATFLCQGVCSLLALFCLLRRLSRLETGQFPRFEWAMLGRIGRIAVPSILQQSFISVGNLFIQGLVNSYGPDVIAGYSAATKLNTFAVTGFTTRGNGISSFTAQNIGAGDTKRVKKGFRAGLVMMLCVVIPIVAVLLLFSSAMIGLFLPSGDADNLNAIAVGVDFLRVVVPFYIVVAVKLIADGVLRGSGSMKEFMAATFTDLVLRVVLSYVLAWALGSAFGIWLSWPIGWSVAAVMSVAFYAAGHWKRNAPQPAEQAAGEELTAVMLEEEME